MAELVADGSRERFVRPLFLITVVIGSFLLFLTQPMIARMALPRVGGAPAVWNSAMLVYQALLLAGYAYAHWLSKLKPRRQAGVHLALFAIAALWLPIGLRNVLLPANQEPAFWVPWFLVTSIGPLFLLISTQAPLMQRWYALESSRGDPYPLYAASNLGSFAGLISYPLLVEPLLPLAQQSTLWTAGHVLLVFLVACCALTIPAGAVEQRPAGTGERPEIKKVLFWILLAAIPSGLMLSTTTHLTTDIVAMPLLWVLPLGLYLLSFALAFSERRGPAAWITFLVPLLMIVTGVSAFSQNAQSPLYSATFELLLLFGVAVALHAEMYRLRPDPQQLTHFYLAMAIGGMLGGVFCAIFAPILFDWIWEHPLLVVAAAGLIPQKALFPFVERIWNSAGKWLRFVIPGIAMAVVLLCAKYTGWVHGTPALAGGLVLILLAAFSVGRPLVFATCIAAMMLNFGGSLILKESLFEDHRIRSYFGVYTVRDVGSPTAYRSLQHGTTLHGLQNLAPGMLKTPTTYYAPRSGVGLAMQQADFLYGPNARIGVVGLGTGTLSCYRKPGQQWRFFEIDPAVLKLSTGDGAFTFFKTCAPDASVLLGDARLTLAREPAGALDMLALDAFSSDAVPMHLLTREAFEVYARALQPKGMLLVHISNRYIDLVPIVAAAARNGRWQASVLDYVPTEKEAGQYAGRSVWVALSRDPVKVAELTLSSLGEGEWQPLPRAPRRSVGWTDDFASILPYLRRSGFLGTGH